MPTAALGEAYDMPKSGSLLLYKYRCVLFHSTNTVYDLCSQSENFCRPIAPSTCLFTAHKNPKRLLTLKLVSLNNVYSSA